MNKKSKINIHISFLLSFLLIIFVCLLLFFCCCFFLFFFCFFVFLFFFVCCCFFCCFFFVLFCFVFVIVLFVCLFFCCCCCCCCCFCVVIFFLFFFFFFWRGAISVKIYCLSVRACKNMKRELVFVLIVHLFLSYAYVNLCPFFSSSWCLELAVASACGSPWTFLFTCLLVQSCNHSLCCFD